MKRTGIFLLMLVLLAACGTPTPTDKPVDAPPAMVEPATSVPVVQPTDKPVEQVVQPTSLPEVQAAAPTDAPAAPALDGAALLEDRCSECHSANKVKQAPRSKSDWENTVNRMIQKGANLSDAEKQALVDYLAQTYGK